MSHDFWSMYNYSVWCQYPEDKIVVRGAAAETARNYYYPNYSPIHPNDVDINYLSQQPNLSFLKVDCLKNDFKGWFDQTKNICDDLNYKILDFVFWEHREGCWQAQNQIESDFLFEVFVPYSNREILDLMLKLPNELRDKKNPILYKKIIEKNWIELQEFEINPPDTFNFIEKKFKYYKAATKYKINKLWIKSKGNRS